MLIYLALLEKHLRIHVYIRYRKSREKDTMADINSISLCVFKFFFIIFCFYKYEWCFKRTRNTSRLSCLTINTIRNQLISIGWNFSPNYVFIDSDYLANRFCESFRVLCRDAIPISPACPVRKDQMTNNSVKNTIICDIMDNIVYFSLLKQIEIKICTESTEKR